MLTSRSGSQGHSAPPPPQSIAAVRRRARHRLIGAAVMVLLGVIGFPLLFDTQPRPIAVDIPIEIPSRHPAAAVTQPAAPPEARVQAPSGGVSAVESLDAREEVIESAKAPDAGPAVSDPAPMVATPSPSPSPVDAAGTPPSVKPGPKALTKIAEKPSERASEKEKEASSASQGNERIVVQVGAFAEVERAREARLKLERAGLKTYTHVADTPQGRRIRVRLGPFATRAEADKAAARAKVLGLPAALLWL